MKKMKTITTIYLDIDFLVSMDEFCSANKINRSDLFRIAVQNYIAEKKQEKVFDNEN